MQEHITDDVNNLLVASLLYVHTTVIVDMNSEWLKLWCGLPFPSSSKSTLLNSIQVHCYLTTRPEVESLRVQVF